MSELEQIKKVITKHKEYIKKKFFVEKIGVFGSYTKSKEGIESDVDILVEFDGPIGWDFIELKDFLENILNKKVDLVSIKALKSRLKDNILNEVIYIWFNKKNQIVLEDILKFCSKIEIYLKDISKVDFENNEMVIDAVLRNLELIGEASKRLSNEFFKKYTNIPWKKVIGLRNIVIHEYSDVDLDIIWDIVTKNIPETKENIQEIYDEILNEEEETPYKLVLTSSDLFLID